MNRRDDVKKVIGDWIVRKHQDTERMCDELDRIYGVLPDDGELADDMWVIKVYPSAVNMSDDGTMSIFVDESHQWVDTKPNPTRYQFRRLCEALGVELKEGKGE